MRIRLLGAAIFLISAVVSVDSFAADSGFKDVAIDRFTADPVDEPDFGKVVQGLSDLLIVDLVNLINPGPDAKNGPYKSCKMRVIEWTRRGELESELAFQQTPYVDPATRGSPGDLIDPNMLVTSHVSSQGGVVKWTMNVTSRLPGSSKITLSGQVPRSELLSGLTRSMADELAKKLCKPEGFEVTARFNDLSLGGTICDPAKPFTLKGKGKTSGIVFTFTPSNEETGSFAVGGTAGGVPWTGGGNYELHQKEGIGTLTMTGKWSIKTPVGVFPGAGTIPGKLTPASGKCKPQ